MPRSAIFYALVSAALFVLATALEYELPIFRKIPIDDVSGRDHRSLFIAPPELNRAQFHFELAHVGHRRIG
jgi:hypothetical protein